MTSSQILGLIGLLATILPTLMIVWALRSKSDKKEV